MLDNSKTISVMSDQDILNIVKNVNVNIFPVAPDDMIVMNIKQDFGASINFNQIHEIMVSIQKHYPNNKVIVIKDKIVDVEVVSPKWVDGLIQQLIYAYPGDKTELLNNIIKNVNGEPLYSTEEEEGNHDEE